MATLFWLQCSIFRETGLQKTKKEEKNDEGHTENSVRQVKSSRNTLSCDWSIRNTDNEL